jgi:hypothetical protein
MIPSAALSTLSDLVQPIFAALVPQKLVGSKGAAIIPGLRLPVFARVSPAGGRRSPAGQRCGPVFGVVNHSRAPVVEGLWRRTGPPASRAHLLFSFPPVHWFPSTPRGGMVVVRIADLCGAQPSVTTRQVIRLSSRACRP